MSHGLIGINKDGNIYTDGSHEAKDFVYAFHKKGGTLEDFEKLARAAGFDFVDEFTKKQ